MVTLIRVTLLLCDYQEGHIVEGYEATVCGKRLEWKGKQYSMSEPVQ